MQEKKTSPDKKTDHKFAVFGGMVIIFASILLGALYPIVGIIGEIFGLWLTTQKRTYREKSQGYAVTPLYKRVFVLVGAVLLVFWNIASISVYNDMQKEQGQTAQQEQPETADPAPKTEQPTVPEEPENPETPPTPEPEKQPADAQNTSKSENPLMKASFETADVKNGTGDKVIGKRGYVKINKSDLKTITNEQFTEFANAKVKDSGLNWVSIICEDGTGISFAGSISYVADYGTIDAEGRITKQIGVIMLEEGGYTYEQTAPESTPAGKDKKQDMTTGQKNALSAAEGYLAYTSFSHSGLIEQLKFEGYSSEEAKFAADNCGADWNQQAIMKAAEYMAFSDFSRSGLVDQLKYEGFTAEQAEYGVAAVYD